MYIPSAMQMPSCQAAWDFIEQYSFGCLMSSELVGTHLPFILKREEGAFGTLYGHFARANPHWKTLDGQSVLVVFNGPHAYISPRWYAKGPAVPTWNYAAVHAKGSLSLLNAEQTLECVDELVSQHDPAVSENADLMPDTFKQKLLNGIVGFKVELTHLEGKWKLGQHRSRDDQAGVHRHLGESDSREAQALADYMTALNIGTGHE
ncbi:FMN-binding negative transcriptional regulator [Saccharospirillum salsuginis]|uniref:Transcriptional regulator n=1 Tax=Saccharospirillum salsuginis TaxID=418750 RepID=A0A918KTE5_9GAMM|nr:FMN-binding negative transcriptional regulator [Saccharospirillum salsuginis]GGX72820.1 transcriptional regulator [Saccharospirillum salsuginis]